MKKVVLLVLLICVVAAHYGNLAILSSHWSVTSKVTYLIVFSFVCSNVALLVTLAWLGTWSTTKRPDGSNQKEILLRIQSGKNPKKTIRLQDEWEEPHEHDIANYKNFLSNH